MKVREIAKEVHEKALKFTQILIENDPTKEKYREAMELPDLYDSNIIDYLVYRCISSSGLEEGLSPVWFHAEQVCDQIGANDVTPAEVEESISRLVGMVLAVDLGSGSIAYPLLPLYATYVDEQGRNIYFATGHGIGAALIVNIAEYAQGVSRGEEG